MDSNQFYHVVVSAYLRLNKSAIQPIFFIQPRYSGIELEVFQRLHDMVKIPNVF